MTAWADLMLAAERHQAEDDATAADLASVREQNGNLIAQAVIDGQTIVRLQDELDEEKSRPQQVRTLFGATAGWDTPGSQTKADARGKVCARFGVDTLPVERIFNEGGNQWAAPPDGANIVLSFALSPSQCDNLAGIQAKLDALLMRAKANPDARYWWCPVHEPDNGPKVQPAQLIAAGRFMQERRDALGVTNVKVGPIVMNSSVLKGTHKQWCWPEMDYFGADTYFRPRGPKTADAVFDPPIAAARELGKPLVIGECSFGPVGGGGTGFTDEEWTEGTRALIEKHSGEDNATEAFCFFETNKHDGDWRLLNHPSAMFTYRGAVVASS